MSLWTCLLIISMKGLYKVWPYVQGFSQSQDEGPSVRACTSTSLPYCWMTSPSSGRITGQRVFCSGMHQHFTPLLLSDFSIIWAPHLAYPLGTDEHLGFCFLSIMNDAPNNITILIFLNFIIKNVVNLNTHTHTWKLTINSQVLLELEMDTRLILLLYLGHETQHIWL